jgi:hypothetical protein
MMRLGQSHLSAARMFLNGTLAIACSLAGCKEYRVEYHKRPSFYEKASTQKLEDEVIMPDGTVIKYNSRIQPTSYGRSGKDRYKPFEIRQEKEDGSIVLRGLMPEHVLINTLTCLRNEEYELMFNQLLAQKTKLAYEEQGGGLDGFTTFMRKNRHEIVASLNRMVAGLPHEEVKIEKIDDAVTCCKLRPQIAEPYQFKSLEVVKESDGMKLLMIR